MLLGVDKATHTHTHTHTRTHTRPQAVNRHTEEGLRYEGVGDCVRRMWREEGLAGMYRGMRVKLAQTVLAAALMMMLKEVRA